MKKEFRTRHVECASRFQEWLLTAWISFAFEYEDGWYVYRFPRARLVPVSAFCEEYLKRDGWEWVL